MTIIRVTEQPILMSCTAAEQLFNNWFVLPPLYGDFCKLLDTKNGVVWLNDHAGFLFTTVLKMGLKNIL